MPVLADFLAPTYSITNRPDLVSDTTAFLNRALTQAHYASEYRFDIKQFDTPYVNSLELSANLPARFRKIYQVFVPDPDNKYRLDEVTPAMLFDDSVQVRKRNTYYLAGSAINFTMSDAFLNIRTMYLQVPTFADSFIATNFPELIHYIAASYVFQLMKNKPRAQEWQNLAKDIEVELQRNYFAI